MIAYIKGKILKNTLNSVIIETNGIGYEVFVPTNMLGKITQTGSEVELFTYLHIREDLLQLYGFTTWEAKDLFLLLINVSGVGPKAALTILSHGTLNQLKGAIGSGNLNILTKIPGIGKKTAQRIIVELKEKMEFDIVDDDSPLIEDNQISSSSDIIAALSSLGYQEGEIRKIYPRLLKDNPNADESTLIKKALQLLAKL